MNKECFLYTITCSLVCQVFVVDSDEDKMEVQEIIVAPGQTSTVLLILLDMLNIE